MEYLITGLTTNELAKVLAGTGDPEEDACPSFICNSFTSPCRSNCSGVGCVGGFTCSSFSFG